MWLLKVSVGACVKNMLRSTMSQERLECLLLAPAEKDRHIAEFVSGRTGVEVCKQWRPYLDLG